MTHATLAMLLGRSATFVNRLVKGAAGARIDSDHAEKLSQVFGTTLKFWQNLQASSGVWKFRN